MTSLRWFLVFAMLPLVAGAQAYRWVDDRGQVHYSQVPPTGKASQQVGPGRAATASPNQEALNRALAEDNEAAPKRREAAAKASEAQAQIDAQCQQSRDQLAYMEAKTARRLGTTDDKGNVSRVTEEQFQQRRAELQQAISDKCS